MASRDTAPYETACVPAINPWNERRRFWSGALHDNGLTALCVPLNLKPRNQQFNWQVSEVDKAKAKLQKRCEAQTVDKIVAELTFGFWSSLFNTQFQHTLWKPLRLAFANCPRQYRQRHTISAALNEARDLRNRVVHHESLLWLTPSLLDMHTKCTTILGWIDPKLVKWVAVHDRLPGAWAAWQAY